MSCVPGNYTTKQLSIRKAPAYHALDCSDMTMTGLDGQEWRSNAINKGYRWQRTKRITATKKKISKKKSITTKKKVTRKKKSSKKKSSKKKSSKKKSSKKKSRTTKKKGTTKKKVTPKKKSSKKKISKKKSSTTKKKESYASIISVPKNNLPTGAAKVFTKDEGIDFVRAILSRLQHKYYLFEGNSFKYWGMDFTDGEIYTMYGRVGSNPRDTTKSGTQKQADALLLSKEKKGYIKL
jgi:predicted DNA-binding WGR domain protein/outer membrane biosynthesis protein TonB